MQNLVTPSAQPAATAQPASVADNSIEQPAEPFDSVLARQLADRSQSAEADAAAIGLPSTKIAGEELIIGVNNEQPGELVSTPAADGSVALPSAMLAVLLSQNTASQPRIHPEQAATHSQGRPAATSTKLVLADDLSTSSPAAPATQAADSQVMSSAFASALEVLKAHDTSRNTTAVKTSEPQPAPTAAIAQQAQPVANTANTNAPVQTAINTPLAHDAWSDEFSQKITWLASQHSQSAELHLNPPQLGPLDVVIKVNGDQATALFTSPHAAVRDSIEQALPKLREMLADNGIMLGNATVSDQPARDQQTGHSGKQPGSVGRLKESPVISAGSSGKISGAGRPHTGMVDTFA